MFYAQHIGPKKPKKLPWYGRWSNCLLILLTTLFMLLGLGLAAVGIVMLVLNKVLSRDEIKALLNETQFNGNLKVGNVLGSLPLLSICVGVVVFFLGIFACCGRGHRNRICLTVFSVFVLWFLIVQILTCAMWVVMRDKFEENDVRTDLQTLFVQYEGVQSDATKAGNLPSSDVST
ncbi:uncharacterized protein LOC123560022 [Mercenaria mercenaria]|uniref:uncharacterized protein LOC123560022 n=1 Tax=Mercenaria mercenaria TaxID=6596 RepID=UPI00234F2B28|nr:uncharacterized protein LOC123560022 [Mercenaria mercenaria]